MLEDEINHAKYYNGFLTIWFNVENNIHVTFAIEEMDTYIFHNDGFIEIKEKNKRITRIKRDLIQMIQLNTKKTFNR